LQNYNYFKQLTTPLKKSGKIGRYENFRKKDVIEFMQKVLDLKDAQPDLFKYNAKYPYEKR